MASTMEGKGEGDVVGISTKEWAVSNPFRHMAGSQNSTVVDTNNVEPVRQSQVEDTFFVPLTQAALGERNVNQKLELQQTGSSKTATPPVRHLSPATLEQLSDASSSEDEGDQQPVRLENVPLKQESNPSIPSTAEVASPRQLQSKPALAPRVSFPRTSEQTLDDPKPVVPEKSETTAQQKAAYRASLDVDAFKRLMLTGSATAVPGASYENSSATSSLSRQSVFEPIQEAADSPRSSHGMFDESEEEKKAEKKKKKPPPPAPKPRHGKPLATTTGETKQQDKIDDVQPRQSVDLADKPLPPSPIVSRSNSIDQEGSFFTSTDALQNILPESPSAATPSKKMAPPPPVTRRASVISRTKSSSSISSLTSPPLNRPSSISSQQGIPGMSSKPAPAPPAPRRRTSNASIASRDMVAIQENLPLASPEIPSVAAFSAEHDMISSESLVSASEENLPISPSVNNSTSKLKSPIPPPRPPTRSSSAAKRNKAARNSVILPPSSSNSSSTANLHAPNTLTGAAVTASPPIQTVPPPPPKPRRTSAGSARSSIDEGRRTSVHSARIEEESEDEAEPVEAPSIAGGPATTAEGTLHPELEHKDEQIDYLAEEVERLQREVDALRGQMAGSSPQV